MNTIYPVILAVPEKAQNLKGRDKVSFLSQHARMAVQISARHAGTCAKVLTKDHKGVPLPFKGNFWSLSHKTLYVAGVVAPTKIGIDIERIRKVSDGLFEKAAGDSEWNLSPNPRSLLLFFRFWTAKESVLKATGEGIAGLSKCKVIEIGDSTHLFLHFKDRRWHVEHYFFDGHIATVVRDDLSIKWLMGPL